jgi:hypothetical protein
VLIELFFEHEEIFAEERVATTTTTTTKPL